MGYLADSVAASRPLTLVGGPPIVIDNDQALRTSTHSLAQGLDETLTLHRLGVYGVLGRSFKTTNCLESVNALVEERCAKVDHWQTSSQRHRWLATALLDIEPRLRKVMGYRHLSKLRDALKRELKIDTTTSKEKAAISNQGPWRVSTKNGLDSASRMQLDFHHGLLGAPSVF